MNTIIRFGDQFESGQPGHPDYAPNNTTMAYLHAARLAQHIALTHCNPANYSQVKELKSAFRNNCCMLSQNNGTYLILQILSGNTTPDITMSKLWDNDRYELVSMVMTSITMPKYYDGAWRSLDDHLLAGETIEHILFLAEIGDFNNSFILAQKMLANRRNRGWQLLISDGEVCRMLVRIVQLRVTSHVDNGYDPDDNYLITMLRSVHDSEPGLWVSLSSHLGGCLARYIDRINPPS